MKKAYSSKGLAYAENRYMLDKYHRTAVELIDNWLQLSTFEISKKLVQ